MFYSEVCKFDEVCPHKVLTGFDDGCVAEYSIPKYRRALPSYKLVWSQILHQICLGSDLIFVLGS